MYALVPLLGYPDLAPLVLRLAIGIIFVVHGLPKVKNINSFMGFIGVCELLGGIALILGFLTSWAALGLIIIMLGAIYKKTVEWKVPFFTLEKMGWEYDFLIIAGCLALLFVGPGSYSADMMWL